MKPYTLLILLFAVQSMNSQITIENSNYIYIDDRLMFSNDYLNLKQSESQFFLRNEAQFIQGSINTANFGIGELSLYQDGNVGAHEYNYWCSPVGEKVNTSTNNAFGISLLNDVIDTTNSLPATFIHNANYNGTASPLNIEPYWIWKFIASDEYSEWIQIQSNPNINPGEGFTMKGTYGTSVNNTGDNQNYDFRGKPNNGTISTPILTNQFTLVGNPYPSALDALAYIHDSENSLVINGTLYYWEQDASVNSHYIDEYDGGYATYTISSDGSIETYVPAVFYMYNGDGSVNVAGYGVPSGKLPKRYIPIAQGFMVEGMNNGVVKTKNSHRVYVKESNSESGFFRSSTINGNRDIHTNPEDFYRLRFNVTFDDLYTRQVVQTFTTNSSNNFDYGLEIINNDLLTKDVFFSDNDNNYLAQANNFDIEMGIPIKFILNETTDISLNLVDVFEFEHTVYIYDALNQTYINLIENVFEISLEEGEYYDRFFLVFQIEENLSINDNQQNENLSIRYNYSKNAIQISNPKNLDIGRLTIYDSYGREIEFNNINKSDSIFIKTLPSISSGSYIAHCTFNGNQKKTVKFIRN